VAENVKKNKNQMTMVKLNQSVAYQQSIADKKDKSMVGNQ
jgi:hypothetical protein